MPFSQSYRHPDKDQVNGKKLSQQGELSLTCLQSKIRGSGIGGGEGGRVRWGGKEEEGDSNRSSMG